MEKQATLLLFHVTDFPESKVDQLIDDIYELGVFMAQVIGVDRSGRRGGNTILVEAAGSDEWRVAALLASSYGISGYHRLGTTHVYQPVNTGERAIVAVYGEKQLGMTVHFRLIGTEANPQYVQVQDDDLESLKNRIQKDFGINVSPAELAKRLETLLSDLNGFVLELHDLKA